MATKLTGPLSGERESFISCRNSQGAEVRATPVRLTRFTVVLEVYNPFSIVQISEVLSEFRITMNDRLVYSGRAVVSNIVNTGIMVLCEATLDDSWLDVDMFSPVTHPGRLRAEFEGFLQEWQKIHTVTPGFKVVVADMQTVLADLRRWLEQVELGIRSTPGGNRAQLERDVINDLSPPILKVINELFYRFEIIAGAIDLALQPMHRSYIKRQLHQLLLCAPFPYRTFQKPLGYAGDYEMVNMILRDPLEGGSLFAKMVNLYFLNGDAAVAHRNRIKYLIQILGQEARRVGAEGRPLKILNLGCGPAGEVQHLLAHDEIVHQMDFTLLDFNDETLGYTRCLLEELKQRHRRRTPLQFVKKSVHQMLKEGSRPEPGQPRYDFVYCAGLFDYLSDRICQRLTAIFYEMLAPGGLLVVTNVDTARPFAQTMEYLLEWHLNYRNRENMRRLLPPTAPAGAWQVVADPTEVNLFLEVRKESGPWPR